MKISAKTTVGISILSYLEKQKNIGTKDLIDHLGISKPYFEQCMKILVNSEIVNATRGCKGGYELAKDSVTYWDIIKIYNEKDWIFVGDSLDIIMKEMIAVAEKHYVIGGA